MPAAPTDGGDGRREPLKVAILLFDGVTALDAVGPFEVLSRVPGAMVSWVGERSGLVRAVGGLSLGVDAAFADARSPDVVVVPGGPGARSAMVDPQVLDWVGRAHAESAWTTSVCTGALILGAAGILQGIEAATHWAARDGLVEFGAIASTQRVVRSGKVMTSAGVSAGIDMALGLAALIAGEAIARGIQLTIEYDPQPPFDSGSLETASPEVVADARQRLGISRSEQTLPTDSKDAAEHR